MYPNSNSNSNNNINILPIFRGVALNVLFFAVETRCERKPSENMSVEEQGENIIFYYYNDCLSLCLNYEKNFTNVYLTLTRFYHYNSSNKHFDQFSLDFIIKT